MSALEKPDQACRQEHGTVNICYAYSIAYSCDSAHIFAPFPGSATLIFCWMMRLPLRLWHHCIYAAIMWAIDDHKHRNDLLISPAVGRIDNPTTPHHQISWTIMANSNAPIINDYLFWELCATIDRTTMNHISTDIQVWFLRHAKTPFDCENSNYDDFIQMLCNGHSTPLAVDPGIDFNSLPKRVDLVGYSPSRRAVETAELLRNKLDVKLMEELELLRDVRFEWDIILRHEYTSLAENRKAILKRWYDGTNKKEMFEDSIARVRKLESFLRERQEKMIVLVTHGWFLRLLDVYFVQGKHTDITLEDILKTKPVPLGHYIKVTVACKFGVESHLV